MFDYLKGRRPGFIDDERMNYYAVMVPVVIKNEEPHILFEVRAGSLRRQPGEICFPGGRRDGDETPIDNAVRETAEELYISPDQIEVIAQMDTLRTVYDTEVSVVLGILHDYEMTYSKHECAEVFLVPLRFFMENDPDEYINTVYTQTADDFPHDKVPGGKHYRWRSGTRSVYFYEYDAYVIWGLTAYIMQGVVKTMKKEGK